MDCIFCQIANKELLTEALYEDDKFMAIKDIKPQAPVDIIIFPKLKPEEHIISINDLNDKYKELIAEMILLGKKVAQENGIGDDYQLHFNIGKSQLVRHIHYHLWGGWREGDNKKYY